jgi:hypothetical protein
MTTLRSKAAKVLVAATAVAAATLGLGAAAAAPASAETYPGPNTLGDVLAQIDGTYGEPTRIHLNSSVSGTQVLEDPGDLSTWGNPARTADDLYASNNSQRFYFYRVTTRSITYSYPIPGAPQAVWSSTADVGVYKIMHYTANGHVLCLDADGTGGVAPGVGAAVTWYGCDPNAVNQPNQLWVYAPVAGRPDDTYYSASALVNVGSLPDTGGSLDIQNAPILAAAASPQGIHSPLSLQAQSTVGLPNSTWTPKAFIGEIGGGGCTTFLCRGW